MFIKKTVHVQFSTNNLYLFLARWYDTTFLLVHMELDIYYTILNPYIFNLE